MSKHKIQAVNTGDHYNYTAREQAGQYKHGDADATSSSNRRSNSLVLAKPFFPSIIILYLTIILNIDVSVTFAAKVYNVKPFTTLLIPYCRRS